MTQESLGDVASTNLPTDRTAFVGRERELAEVSGLLGANRLVTLTGTGGTGKTRLAIRVGSDLLEVYRDGVWMVDLAPLSDPSLVAARLASVLSVKEEHGRPIQDSLADACSGKEMLVLLDNCEHVSGACAVLADRLIPAAPTVGFLATSRQPLGIGGERVWPAPPLSVPEAGAAVLPEDMDRFDAIALFLDRARQADPSFAIGPGDLGHIVEICRRLDGIPLAIELAAARVSILAPSQIAARIGDRFRLLTGGPPTAPERQQTLRAAIDWSYELLAEAERNLFRSLAVFPGSFTLEAVEDVCSGEIVARQEVLDLLDQLVRQSLVAVRRGGDRARYLLNETTRAYAVEKLTENGEEGALRDHQRDWSLTLVQEAENHVSGPEQGHWLDILGFEIDNLRAGLEWSAATSPEAALLLASGLARYWMVRGSWSEGQRWLQNSLDAAPDADPSARLEALDAAAVLADLVSEYEVAEHFHEQQLALGKAINNRRAVGEALRGIAWSVLRRGDLVRAYSVAHDGVQVWRELGDKSGLADALITLAFATQKLSEARELGQEALALTREVGDQEAVAGMEMRVGGFALLQGDFAAARAAFERSLALARELDYQRYIARGIHSLGDTALVEGDLPTARRLLEEALELWPMVGHRNAVAQALYALGEVARLEGDFVAAQSTLEDALARCRQLEMEEDAAWVLTRLGELARARGELNPAEVLHREALSIGGRLSSWFVMAPAIEGLGGIAATRGEAASAARLLGAAQSLREAMGAPLPPVYRVNYEADVAAARRGLDDDEFTASWAEGRATRLEDVLVSHGVGTVAHGAPTAVPATTPNGRTPAPAIFRRDGEYFTIAFRGPPFRLKDSKGLRHIARLLREPEREYHVMDLATEVSRSPRTVRRGARGDKQGIGDAGEIIDTQAREAYQQRLEDLRDELRQAEEWGDAERERRAHDEIAFLSRELSAGFGLGGRARHAASNAERARVNVTRAIRSAIDKIAAPSPHLARYLSGTIKTGTYCSYTPDPRFPTSWVL